MKAPILLVLAALSTTQAAEPETLTLACEGKEINVLIPDPRVRPEPVSMSIVFDFTARTVRGFYSLVEKNDLNDPTKITSLNEVAVHFSGKNEILAIDGDLDRVSGDLEATIYKLTPVVSIGEVRPWLKYSLKCKPTFRAHE